jgi:hypothetical protein
MANDEHVALLKKGVAAWDEWRNANREIDPDLSEANLRKADLREANLGGANLSTANLSDANLRGASLVEANFTGADLTGCRIYGISAWGLKLDEETMQRNLVITPENEPGITVDNIEVAQFVYLMLHNEKIRDVIDTITSMAVLFLGRFKDERKAVLDALREELRKRATAHDRGRTHQTSIARQRDRMVCAVFSPQDTGASRRSRCRVPLPGRTAAHYTVVSVRGRSDAAVLAGAV